MKKFRNILALTSAAVYLLSVSLCCCIFNPGAGGAPSETAIHHCCKAGQAAPAQDSPEEDGPCKCCVDRAHESVSFKKSQVAPEAGASNACSQLIYAVLGAGSPSTGPELISVKIPPPDRDDPGKTPEYAASVTLRGPPVMA